MYILIQSLISDKQERQLGLLSLTSRQTCSKSHYSATYRSQTRDQLRFTISEVAADWHEPMVLQRIMWPSIAHANGQLDQRCSQQTHHRPN